jgi:hypothetical protein
MAKGTIISIKLSTTLGGQPLGRQYCEVIVTCIMKHDAILPHLYDNMETIADARMMSVAWSYNRVMG